MTATKIIVRGLWRAAVLAAAPFLAMSAVAEAQIFDRPGDVGPPWSDRAPYEEPYASTAPDDDRWYRDEGDGDRARQARHIGDADDEVFSALDAYGVWLDHPEWGTVWRPNVRPDWRPYTVGRWVNTEEYGWYWDSAEPFGWAVFHYGRWVFDDREGGWLWLPGTEWAPAWVAWSHSDDWVGWAPLPPDAIWDEDRGLTVRASFYEPRYAPWWVFVSPRAFIYPSLHRHIAPRHRSVEFLRIVRPATRYRWHNRRVFNGGISVRDIERLTRTRLAPTRIFTVRRPEFGTGDRTGRIAVFQPRIAPSSRWQSGRTQGWRQFDGRRKDAALVPRGRSDPRTGRDGGRQRDRDGAGIGPLIERRGTETREPGSRGTAGRGPENWGSQSRGLERRGPESRGTAGRGPENWGSQSRGLERRGPESRGHDTGRDRGRDASPERNRATAPTARIVPPSNIELPRLDRRGGENWRGNDAGRGRDSAGGDRGGRVGRSRLDVSSREPRNITPTPSLQRQIDPNGRDRGGSRAEPRREARRDTPPQAAAIQRDQPKANRGGDRPQRGGPPKPTEEQDRRGRRGD